MIDPDSIIITEQRAKDKIDLGNVPDFDYETYPGIEDDDKEYKKYMSDIEKEVRGSFEYRVYIQYLRNYMDMHQCAFIATVSNKESTAIKIELHHYPFTLYDICEIVYRKRSYYKESLELEMVAKEVMLLHYKLMIGLIPLSVTVHKLVHNGKLFIPIDKVIGRYDLFMDYYDPFITIEHKDIISRMEKYTYEEKSELLNTSILDANNLHLVVIPPEYKLPPVDGLNNAMKSRIETIKNNSYRLPTVREQILIENKFDRKPIQKAICRLSAEEIEIYKKGNSLDEKSAC